MQESKSHAFTWRLSNSKCLSFLQFSYVHIFFSFWISFSMISDRYCASFDIINTTAHQFSCFCWVAGAKWVEKNLLAVEDLVDFASNAGDIYNFNPIHILKLPRKNLRGNFVHPMTRSTVPFPSWWNPDEQKILSSLSKNASMKAGSPPRLCHNAKHLGLQLPDQESSTMQLTGQSCHKVDIMGRSNCQDQCVSSESGIYSLLHEFVIMSCYVISISHVWQTIISIKKFWLIKFIKK